MKTDGRFADNGSTLTGEVCIIGTGPAGITAALELARNGLSVVLLESGGEVNEPFARDMLRGENTGIPYEYADGSRGRFLGGASNYWGGWCRPLDRSDFMVRPWVANSGWPIGYDDVEPHYRRSHRYLQLGPFDYDLENWVNEAGKPDVKRVPLNDPDVSDSLSQFSAPTAFGRLFHDDLVASEKITLVLNATVVSLDSDAAGRTVSRANVVTRPGHGFMVEAKTFIVACGGIDNARLLLASDGVKPAGLGNDHDQVGRYFMDHPRLYSGDVRLNGDWARNRLYDHMFHHNTRAVEAFGTRFAAAFVLSAKTQEREQISNARVWLRSMYIGEDTQAAAALVRTKHRLKGRVSPQTTALADLGAVACQPFSAASFFAATYLRHRSLVGKTKMQAIVEPEPNPDSRVTLVRDQRDCVGMPRVRVNWQLTRLARRTFDRNFALVGAALQKSGMATVTFDTPLEPLASFPVTPEGTWHHMGTTRMHTSPRHGVVDENLRVHGMGNVFIAGSSVFPTVGANFPTQLLVALSIRLADHLAQRKSAVMSVSSSLAAPVVAASNDVLVPT